MDGQGHDGVEGDAASVAEFAGEEEHFVLLEGREVLVGVGLVAGDLALVVFGVAGEVEDDAHQFDARVDADFEGHLGGRGGWLGCRLGCGGAEDRGCGGDEEHGQGKASSSGHGWWSPVVCVWRGRRVEDARGPVRAAQVGCGDLRLLAVGHAGVPLSRLG